MGVACGDFGVESLDCCPVASSQMLSNHPVLVEAGCGSNCGEHLGCQAGDCCKLTVQHWDELTKMGHHRIEVEQLAAWPASLCLLVLSHHQVEVEAACRMPEE